jgi:hypothetical protein
VYTYYIINFKTNFVLGTVTADNYMQARRSAQLAFPDAQLVVR